MKCETSDGAWVLFCEGRVQQPWRKHIMDEEKDRNKWQIFISECHMDWCWVSQKFVIVVCKR